MPIKILGTRDTVVSNDLAGMTDIKHEIAQIITHVIRAMKAKESLLGNMYQGKG